jgi:maltose phosphorylase
MIFICELPGWIWTITTMKVKEGCHITSMAGTWMSIVEGFGGMRVEDDQLCFSPKIPEQWTAYSFKINFRNQIVKGDE